MEDPSKKINLATPIAVVFAGLIIAGAIYFGDRTEQPAPPADDQAAALALVRDNLRPVAASDYRRGASDAELVVIEYSDLECPFCKAFHIAMTKVLADRDESFAWVFRHFPLIMGPNPLHPKAEPEAVAAACVGIIGDNNTFWSYIDKIFAITPSNNGLDLALLPTLAADLGINQADFNRCLDSGEGNRLVNTDLAEGVAMGVNGTPFVVVLAKDGTAYPIFQLNPKDIADQDVKDLAQEIYIAYDDAIKTLFGQD